jgi:MFS family permease
LPGLPGSSRRRPLGVAPLVGAVRLRGAGALLADSRFRLLFFATLGSGFGTWVAVVALQIDIYDRTHSGLWVGALLVANILPAVFLGLLAGPLVDRLSRKRLMIGSDLGRLAVFAALPFVHTPGAIVALAGVAGVGTAFFRPAVLAGLPNLVPDDQLGTANGLLQVVEWTAMALGPLVGGALTEVSGPSLAYWVNAATFALSALLVSWIPARLLQSQQAIGRGHWSELKEGFAVVRRSRELLCVLVAWSIVMVASGAINVAEVFLAKISYSSGNLGFGLLWAASGVGFVLGGLGGPRMIEDGLARAYLWLLGAFAFGIAAAAAAPDVWVGAAVMVLAGFGNGGAIVANITFVQRGAPDRVRGRAFTLLISANYAVLGAAFVIAGPITDVVGARWVYAGAAVTILIGAATAWQLVGGRRAEPAVV